MRHYSNQRGEGRLFSVTFMDDSGEIKGTAWNAMADNLYEKLQENRVYFVSKARAVVHCHISPHITCSPLSYGTSIRPAAMGGFFLALSAALSTYSRMSILVFNNFY